MPLFPRYVFCRFDELPSTDHFKSGVVAIVGVGKQPAPISEQEIEAIQTILNSGIYAESCRTFAKAKPSG